MKISQHKQCPLKNTCTNSNNDHIPNILSVGYKETQLHPVQALFTTDIASVLQQGSSSG